MILSIACTVLLAYAMWSYRAPVHTHMAFHCGTVLAWLLSRMSFVPPGDTPYVSLSFAVLVTVIAGCTGLHFILFTDFMHVPNVLPSTK